MSIQFLQNKFTLIDDILKNFYLGAKPEKEFRIGAEIERINISNKTFEAISYLEIENFLRIYSEKYNWKKIVNDNHLLGLEKDGNIISLEPGSQLELSIAPCKDIFQLKKIMDNFNSQSAQIAEKMGFSFLGYGIQPLSTFDKIKIIPKKRYKTMTEYFKDKGALAYVMMRETAGCQVTLDYQSEKDAMRKLRLGMILAPIISSMFANSPIRGGKQTGYQSFRAQSWLFVDEDRCGIISKKLIEDNFSFRQYMDYLLDSPMIFVTRNNKNIKIPLSFREYLKSGWQGLFATIDDFNLHANLFFPEVRLKNFLEFRNADAQSPLMALALMALYKGIFYNEEALIKTEKLFENIDFQTLEQLRQQSPQKGLQTHINGSKILEFAINLIKIAKKSLNKQAEINNQETEGIFLNILQNFTLQAKTPSDILIEKTEGKIEKILELTKIHP